MSLFDQLKKLVETVGFQDVVVTVLIEFMGRKGTLMQLVHEGQYPELEPEERAAVVKNIREAMQPFDKGRETQLPSGIYIATGYK